MFKQIRIQNYKNISDYSYSPDSKIAVIVGPNGKGKTSIKEAIIGAFTGVFPTNCIKEGQDTMIITVYLDDSTVFSRMYSRTAPSQVKLNGRVTTAKSLQEFLENKFHMSKRDISYSISEDVVKNLKSTELGDFLISHIPEETDAETVIGYCRNADEKIKEYLIDILPDMPEKFGVDVIKATNEELQKKLKVLKKEQTYLKGKKETLGITTPKRTLAEVDADIDSIVKAIGNQEAIRKSYEMWQKIVNDSNNLKLKLSELYNKYNKIEATKPIPEEKDKLQETITNLQESLISLNSTKATLQENIRIFKQTLENLNKPICPISNKLICTTDKSFVKEEVELLKEKNLKILEDTENKITSVRKQIEESKNNLNDILLNEKRYQEKTLLAKQYNENRKLLTEVPPEPTKPKDLEMLKKQKVELQKEKDSILSFEELGKVKERMAEIKSEIEVVNNAHKALEPKGAIMSGILNHYMNIFDSVVNSKCKLLGLDYEFKFVSSQGVKYYIKPPTQDAYIEYENLSSGEKTITMFLILDMINSLTGLKMLEIDNLDNLDSDSLTALFELITSEEVIDEYEHILLCSVNHSDVIETIEKYPVDIL